MNVAPEIRAFFDEATFTASYLVADPGARRAAIVDPVLDFDAKSGRTATRSADAMLAAAAEAGWTVDWVLETHVHADHLTAAQHIASRTGARIATGAQVGLVQRSFAPLFGCADLTADGSQFDRLFADGDRFEVGGLRAEVLHTPGHTPACVCYLIGDALFAGDTLFMPDYGTARCDFPGGDAAQMYRSIQRIYALPPQTRLFLCHDYKAPGRDRYAWETTVAAQRAGNLHVRDGTSEAEFVALRRERDRTLAVPALLLPAVQINIRAGRLPEPDANGIRHLKLPLDAY